MAEVPKMAEELRREIEELHHQQREDIMANKSIQDALVYEEFFFKSKPMDYINTSHPNFVGGSKVVEIVLNSQWGPKTIFHKVAPFKQSQILKFSWT